jgi:uncharacterized lipoprotein NlpE involved in copper resistance
MKNLFLSLAVIATLTVVSCKNAAESAEAVVDSTAVEAVEAVAPAVDSAAVAVDSAAATAVEAVKEVAAPAKK